MEVINQKCDVNPLLNNIQKFYKQVKPAVQPFADNFLNKQFNSVSSKLRQHSIENRINIWYAFYNKWIEPSLIHSHTWKLHTNVEVFPP